MRHDWLDAFLTFSESLNFTRAAERLHISQPALHVKIRKLADSLGTPLYRKQGRELVLTEEGRKIQLFARELRERTRVFVDEFRAGPVHEPVVLAAGEGAFLYLLGPAILEFRRRTKHPITLMNADRDGCHDGLRAGKAHLAVTAAGSLPSDFRATPLTQVHQVLIVPRAHALARKRQVKLADLRGEHLVLPPADRPHRVAIEQALASQGVPWELAVEARGWELMMHFVKLGAGVAIVNGCVHVPSTLAALPIPELPKIGYHVIERRDGWARPAVERLKKTLLEQRDAWQRGS